jgi:hypothetical protein
MGFIGLTGSIPNIKIAKIRIAEQTSLIQHYAE